ncbi:hypothetical protein HII31_06987 [Pseudocercospora fuligena]|uniref:Uncharacterized protein n=1 Tax=Pseudocercospora fuligena TaxID=685502 RepID=A0A8H6VHA0_9PEZI|nr:hypothetical protein HII31_06987 [Pseudocercospora fuligena]
MASHDNIDSNMTSTESQQPGDSIQAQYDDLEEKRDDLMEKIKELSNKMVPLVSQSILKRASQKADGSLLDLRYRPREELLEIRKSLRKVFKQLEDTIKEQGRLKAQLGVEEIEEWYL